MNNKTQPKQPKKPTEEKQNFKTKIDRLKGKEFESLQEFIKTLDSLN